MGTRVAEPTDGPLAGSPACTAPDPAWDLLARAAAGDGAAFERLVEQYQDRLIGLCQRLLGERAAAEDAAQEVLVRLFKKASSLEPRGQLYTWLYRVATNLCLNRLRRRRIVRFISLGRQDEADRGWIDPVDERPDPERSAAASARWRRTKRWIAELPDSQRAVLVLAKFEGMSYRQIAQVLEITEGAVESRLFRAMSRLRKAAQESSSPRVSE